MDEETPTSVPMSETEQSVLLLAAVVGLLAAELKASGSIDADRVTTLLQTFQKGMREKLPDERLLARIVDVILGSMRGVTTGERRND